MKKLLYLSNLRLPTERAYGIQIAKMCEAFSGQAEVELFYPDRNNPIKEDIFEYYSVKKIFKLKKLPAIDFYLPEPFNRIAVDIKSFISAITLAFYALFSKADIIYSRDELILFLLSFFRKNIFFEAHRFSSKRIFFYSRFKKKGVNIIAITQSIKNDLASAGYNPNKILVAHDGVDLEEFNVSISKEDARKFFFSNLHHEAFGRKKIAVYIGSLYNWKGVGIFSEIAGYLTEINPNYIVCIFGGIDVDIKNLQNEINIVLKKIHPSFVPMIYVDFHGQVPHQDIPHILKAADCAILTGKESEDISAKYTSPLKMFEYMASGCPIVAQKLPSFMEVLNNDNSFLVEPGNAKALADKINWVFDEKNAETVKTTAAKALKDVQEYTWSKRAEKILNFIG